MYEREIAPARTFVYYEDVQPLLEKGLIKGGSLENAIVLRGDTILSKEPLRFPDEFARHKILDIVGDLMLSGKRIMGHVIAVKPATARIPNWRGSSPKHYRRLDALMPAAGQSAHGRSRARHQRGHAHPAAPLPVPDGRPHHRLRGRKQMHRREIGHDQRAVFPGHFPGHPVMPGVLQLEAMAQVASILMLRMPENAGKIGYFMCADEVKFRKPVVPGDTLFIEAEILKNRRNIGQARGRCIVNGDTVSEATLMFSLFAR